jgi:type IV pilus assembly protein PilB
LGVDNFKIGGALLGSIAQRLLRQICSECKEVVEPNEQLLKALSKDASVPADSVFYRGRGCKKCVGTGYSGRIPIYEIMIVTPAMAEAVENGLPATKLRQIATSGMSNSLPPAWNSSPAVRRRRSVLQISS